MSGFLHVEEGERKQVDIVSWRAECPQPPGWVGTGGGDVHPEGAAGHPAAVALFLVVIRQVNRGGSGHGLCVRILIGCGPSLHHREVVGECVASLW